MTQALAAVLWDFDGTLADSEPLWIAAEFALVEGLGAEWDLERAHQLVGNSLIDSGAFILASIGRPDLSPAWVVEQLLAEVVTALKTQPIPWCPGALDLLASFREAGVPCALVSASYRVLLDAVLTQLPPGTFAATVAGDEVSRGKPDPEPYTTACAKLGVAAADCVVIEDSVPGAASGNASGALVLVVPNHVTVPPAPRRIEVATLADLDAAAVAELFAGADA